MSNDLASERSAAHKLENAKSTLERQVNDVHFRIKNYVFEQSTIRAILLLK